MTESIRTDRRNFLVKTATMAGGLALGVRLPLSDAEAADSAAQGPEVTHWILIKPDDTVVVRIARSELGQGTFTGLAMLVAEELECDWNKVQGEYADVNEHVRRDRIFGSMSTGGSRGIRDSQEYVRKGGAAAREMLIAAAAKRWGVPAEECSVSNGIISHPDGRRITYGKIAGAAAEMIEHAFARIHSHPMGNGHPRFFGWVNSPPAPLGVLADFLASALNQNVGAWTIGPAAVALEALREVLVEPGAQLGPEGGLLGRVTQIHRRDPNHATAVCQLITRTYKALTAR